MNTDIPKDANLLLYGADPVIIKSVFHKINKLMYLDLDISLFFKYSSIYEQGMMIDASMNFSDHYI
ncbi:hypothetical protein CS369_01835 [Candidatus Symbiopectobacterium sp. 'North America']|nr:hypothetical protein [Candidatus Symbiopectobacterium sp. 'North America']